MILGVLLALNACTIPGSTRRNPVSSTHSTSPLVYAGTYTQDRQGNNRPDGIYVYRMDPATGALSLQSKAGGPPNPSFLTTDPSGRYLLAVSETGQYQGQVGGGVSSYTIDPASGALALINSDAIVTAAKKVCYRD